MRKFCGFVGSLSIFYLAITSPLQAQIIPDATLPNPSIVTQNGSTSIINGGTQAGSNLFHSFTEFSVITGNSASFQQLDSQTQNIISRVTGSSVSNIDGLIELLQSNGSPSSANFFLLNPNGIIFGSNVRLNVGGSFLASTASSINFADGTNFSATDTQTTPLLTVSVPVGLRFGSAGNILVNGSQLVVQPGKTLALVGGDVSLSGGNIGASGRANLVSPGGRIELGSVTGNSLVNITSIAKGWELDYQNVPNFQDIQVSQQAFISASGEGGGDIGISGRRVTLTDGSQIVANTQGSASGGTFAVNASESVELIGSAPGRASRSGLFARVNQGATGSGGNLTITTGRLTVRDGAQVDTSTRGQGNGGNLTVKATDAVEVIGRSSDRLVSSGLGATVQDTGSGAGGNLTIDTGRLIIRDGAQIATSTFGSGNAGNLTVGAREVEMVGYGISANDRIIPSSLFATVEANSTGIGGNLTITSDRLSLTDGAQVSVTTNSTQSQNAIAGNLTVQASEIRLSGDAISADGKLITNDRGLPFPSGLFAGTGVASKADGGTLNVIGDRLLVQNGAVVQTTTFGEGKAGELRIQASESVEVTGKAQNNIFPSGLLALSGGFTRYGLPGFTEATGRGGDISIQTGQLLIKDGATVTVGASGSGDAGRLEVIAPQLQLDTQGTLTAETASGKGGSITLQVPNLVMMRRGSQISTTAGTAGGPGAGGNISIKSDFIIGLENSDITANSFGGAGGVVDITTQGVFGLKPRQALTQESDITAFSQTAPALNGQITINTSDVDPTQGLVPLSNNLFSSEQIVAGSCLARRNVEQSRFTVTGTGGIPTTPYAEIDGWYAMPAAGRRAGVPPALEKDPQTVTINARTITNNQVKNWKPGDPIVEAQGIIVLADGRTVLSSMSHGVSETENLICRTD
jgi:filamentous hemagglutinin family protein